MPPTATVTREQILAAAFELVRREGIAALSARRVARELGCSTQPVYSAYSSMEALRRDVLERAQQVARRYLIPGSSGDLPFLQIGLGSLRFARDEPELFKLPAVLPDLAQGKPPPDFLLAGMKADPLLAGLSEEQLSRIHALMWFFSQGLTTLFSSEAPGDPMKIAETYLTVAGQAVVELELRRGRRPAGAKKKKKKKTSTSTKSTKSTSTSKTGARRKTKKRSQP